jgi:hypothetical protein
MIQKVSPGAKRNAVPANGVNSIEPGSPLPPKPLSRATIERIRQVSATHSAELETQRKVK